MYFIYWRIILICVTTATLAVGSQCGPPTFPSTLHRRHLQFPDDFHVNWANTNSFFWSMVSVDGGVCKQSRWRHSVTVPSQDGGYVLLWQRYDNKMADMCYYGNVMTTTRWRICVTMATLWQQQDGGYVLLWQRYDNNKMADMCYYGNVMTTTRWRICVTMTTLWQQQDGGCVTLATLWQQQDGGYVLLWQRYENNKMADMCYYGNVMTTTRWRICVTMETLFYIFNSTVIDWTCLIFLNITNNNTVL